VADNKLFYGDNLDVLRRYVRDESVDLIYLDPSFNSRQDYNVLFAEKDGTRSSSQITAFEDTWEWNLDAERAYSLIIFVYTKTDDAKNHTGILNIDHTIFVESERTADYQMTRGLQEILEREGNEDDLVAFMNDKMLPVDEIEARSIARELIKSGPPKIGYLTISNALQWRLQYGRVIAKAGEVDGIIRIR
jgi:16S rRNA G966 N2-methylase RsmD